MDTEEKRLIYNAEKPTARKDILMSTVSSLNKAEDSAESAIKSAVKRTTKVVTLSCLFPELKGGRCRQQGRGKGSTLQAALGAATRDLLKQKGLKAQRYTGFTATVSIGTITEEINDEGASSENQAE
jgi:hypothetical protein